MNPVPGLGRLLEREEVTGDISGRVPGHPSIAAMWMSMSSLKGRATLPLSPVRAGLSPSSRGLLPAGTVWWLRTFRRKA